MTGIIKIVLVMRSTTMVKIKGMERSKHECHQSNDRNSEVK